MSKLSSKLYKASRSISKAASVLNDIETLASGDPKKVIRRAKRKKTGKILNKINRKIINKL